MLNQAKMKEQVASFQIYFNEEEKKAYITKGTGQSTWVKVSTERAIEWVNAGIDDLDCRSKKEMLEMLNSWLGGKENV